jgi:cytochrome d ubiquinol oxidase subunit II
MPFQVLVAVVGLGTMGALYASRFQLARVLAMTQVVLVIGGWAMAQYPYVVVPDVTVADTAPEGVVWSMLTVLAVGAAPLAAAYGWMVWVFRGGDAPIDHRVPRPDGQG